MKKKAIIVSGYFNPLHKGHIEYFHNAKKYNSIARYIFLVTGITLVIVGTLNHDKDYTFWNFIYKPFCLAENIITVQFITFD